MSARCLKCGAQCCRYFCLEIDKPESFSDFEDVRWFLMHEGVTVYVDEGQWFVQVANRCKMLTEDHRCGDYDNRPLICRQYDLEACDYSDRHYGYEAEFKTPEELAAYARRSLGEGRYARAMARLRAKDRGREPTRRPSKRRRSLQLSSQTAKR